MGRKYKVKMSNNLSSDYHGLCEPDISTIYLASSSPKDRLESVFYHELVHAILATMGQNELYADERFVEVFSGLLHQAVTSMKGRTV